MKGFKYQITVKILLSKYKGNGNKEFTPVYFNSAAETVINSKYMLDKIDNWIQLITGLTRDLVGYLNQ